MNNRRSLKKIPIIAIPAAILTTYLTLTASGIYKKSSTRNEDTEIVRELSEPEPVFTFNPGSSSGVSVATGDMNGDGRLDLIVGTTTNYTSVPHNERGKVHVLLNNGDGTYSPQRREQQ